MVIVSHSLTNTFSHFHYTHVGPPSLRCIIDTIVSRHVPMTWQIVFASSGEGGNVHDGISHISPKKQKESLDKTFGL